MKDIAIFGAGGFGREVACLIQLINKEKPTWNFIGFFDDNPKLRGTKNEYGEILGGMEALNNYGSELSLAIAIGSPQTIKKVQESIVNPKVSFPNLIAPSAVFLDRDNVRFGKGNIICSCCLFSCNVHVGDFNVFNGFIPVGHDCVVGNYNVIMPSVNISGGVKMGDCNFLGVKAVVLQNVVVGKNVRLAANSVLIKKAKDDSLYLGNPAKIVKI